jgi:hypothetical protein
MPAVVEGAGDVGPAAGRVVEQVPDWTPTLPGTAEVVDRAAGDTDAVHARKPATLEVVAQDRTPCRSTFFSSITERWPKARVLA